MKSVPGIHTPGEVEVTFEVQVLEHGALFQYVLVGSKYVRVMFWCMELVGDTGKYYILLIYRYW